MDQINKGNIDQWMFRSVENDLSVSEAEALLAHLSVNAEVGFEQDLWSNANVREIEIEDFPALDSILKEEKGGTNRFIPLLFIFLISTGLGLFVMGNQQQVLLLPDLYSSINIIETSNTQGIELTELPLSNEAKIETNINSATLVDSVESDKQIKTTTPTSYTPTPPVFPVQPVSPTIKSKLDLFLAPINPGGIPTAQVTGDLQIFEAPKKNNSSGGGQGDQPSKKDKRKTKRNDRKDANAKYEKEVRNGKDPKIIPLPDIGF